MRQTVTNEMNTTEPDPDLLTIDRVAMRLGISPWTVRKYCRTGTLASVKLGTRILIPTTEIYRIIGENLRPAIQR